MDSILLTAGFAACVLVGIGIAALYRRHIPFFARRRHEKRLKRFFSDGAYTPGYQTDRKQEQNTKGETVFLTEYSFTWEQQTYRKVVKTPEGVPVPPERMFFFDPSCPAAAICKGVPDFHGYRGYAVFLGIFSFFLSFIAFLNFQHTFDPMFAQLTPLLEQLSSQPRIGAFSLALLLIFVLNMELISSHFDRLERRKKRAIRLGHAIKGTLENQISHRSPEAQGSRRHQSHRPITSCTGTYRYELNGKTQYIRVSFSDTTAPHFHYFYYIDDPKHLFYEGEPEVLMPLRILLQVVLSGLLLYLVLLV